MSRPPKDKNQNPIRDFIQYQLKQQGVTQCEVAEAMGISHQTLSRRLGNPQTLMVRDIVILSKFGGFDPMILMAALADSRRRKLEVTLSA